MVWETPAVVTADETEQWPAALVDEYTERYWTLVRMATMLLGSRAEAEEVTQDAFLATARAWDRVREVRPYLRRAVVNGATGVLRRRTIAARHHVDSPPSYAPPQLVELRDVLLALRFVEDLPDAEIAATLGCREATVRSLSARGLAAIRKELT
jgi:DNA-directed RNA polymerase specialized sigma24 family protein